ncbi:MAG: hypothetical protein M1286_02905 [Candidatus Marsarchaeota archaeon]|nr:hypothetical protein [Candidatus Marsarchaeota archaeon]
MEAQTRTSSRPSAELAESLRVQKEFNPSLMIQRLAYPDPIPHPEHPFGPFGAGGSGLTERAYLMLNRLFAFDYMGDADYEFGNLQKTLNEIFEYGAAGKLVKGQTSVGADTIYYICHTDIEKEVRSTLRKIATREHIGRRGRLRSRHWIGLKESLDERRAFPQKLKELEKSKREVALREEALKNAKDAESARIGKIRLDRLNADIWFTEASRDRKPQWRAGGIEYNNQFMFFIEQEMCDKAAKLFHVPVGLKENSRHGR